MALRPMLFVGCGGSGGVTLQYVMDNLTTEIVRAAEAKSIHDGQNYELPPRILPQAWQFVHVDVPSSPDGEDPTRPPSVPKQGGLYVGLAPEGLTWDQVARRVWNKGKETRPDLVAGWLRNPGPTDPPLANGAGQERAVGRGVTLSSVKALSGQLELASGNLNNSRSIKELRYVASIMDAPFNQTPAVFIVSSMAGGSGASMVLDVAQLLARMNPDLAKATAVFLYTSEVFSALPPALRKGVEPNGLAALGELIATSLGSNQSEGELLQALGAEGHEVEQPFKRIFPIGNKHGQRGAIFGDGSQESIYRAMGRGLASLVSSPQALNEFLAYDMTNSSAQATDTSWLGEGSSNPDPVLWGSFGFARLSLGRDRYGEYVAQRLARLAVDRVVSGHVRVESQSGEADMRAAAADWTRRLERDLGFPTEVKAVSLLGRGGRADIIRAEIQRNSRESMRRLVFSDSQLSNPSLSGSKFLRILRNVFGGSQAESQKLVQEEAYRLVHTWHAEFVADLLAELDLVIADKGLMVARQVLLGLRDRVAEWRDKLTAESNRLAPQGAAFGNAVSPEAESSMQSLTSVPGEHPMRNKLQGAYSESMSKSTAGVAARLMADVLADFWPSFGEPLVGALADQHGRLVGERSRPVRPMAVADLRSNVYAEWPVPGNPVPERFRGAHNEVVLMDVDRFPAQFDADLRKVAHARTGGGLTDETFDIVLREIIIDRWSGHNETVQGSGIVTMAAHWVPEKLTTDPGDSTTARSRSAARFVFRLSPRDLLERSRAWVWRPDGEIGPFLKEGLRSYMDPFKQEFESRRVELASQFEATMQQALPLVAVDPDAFGNVHPDSLAEDFKFSSLPFEGLAGVDEMLRQVIRDRPSVSQKVVGVFDAALGQGNAIAHIDIFGSYPPMSPLAFPSLLQPLIKAWREAVAQKHTSFFWTNRRARPLTGSLPMSEAERQAMAAGYVVGKITGRIRGTYETRPNTRSHPIEIYSEDKRAWLAFPNPLLTPYVTGANGKRTYVADELPALLESQLLALAECGFDTTLEPLLPYVELRHLFARLVQSQQVSDAVDRQNRGYDMATGASYLAQWIVGGVRPPGAVPFNAAVTGEDGEPFDLSTTSGRRAASLRYCEVRRDKFARAFRIDDFRSNPHFSPFDRRPMIAALAPDMVWAFDAVAALIEDLELSDSPADADELADLEL